MRLGNTIHTMGAKPSSGVLDIVLPHGCHIASYRYSSKRPMNAGLKRF